MTKTIKQSNEYFLLFFLRKTGTFVLFLYKKSLSMSFYNFSSTDPNHYNRIRVVTPNQLSTPYVHVCVTTFTCNCNIEVMNENDYIDFLYKGENIHVTMEPYSKLSSASIPYIFQECFDKLPLRRGEQQNLILDDDSEWMKYREKYGASPIEVSMTGLDTIRFICDDEFSITDMSYNMKLITGFYCAKSDEYPIVCESFATEQSKAEKVNKDITKIEFTDLNMRIGDYLPLDRTITPPDAYGYSLTYKSSDELSAPIDSSGYVTGLKATDSKSVTITIEVRNPNTSMFVKPDFTCKCNVKVYEPKENIEITSVEIPEEISLMEGTEDTIYPKISPTYATYIEKWESEDPSICTVNNGYLRALKPGKTTINYVVENVTQTIRKEISIEVTSSMEEVTKYRITANSVGYMLSTPILYLLTNVGNHIFYNEMETEGKIQCGTICMCLNNSFSSSFPIVAQQSDIVTKCPVGATTDFSFVLVDANMKEVKLLNPMYITVMIKPDEEEQLITPGLIKT